MLIVIFIAISIPITIPVNKMIDKGVSIPIYVGSITILIGSWLRLLVGKNGDSSSFIWLNIGNAVVAFGQPFLLTAPAKVAALWFGDHERALGTMIGALSCPLGCLIGFIIPNFWISGHNDIEKPWSDDIRKLERENTYEYLFWQNIILTLLAAPVLVILRP